jgi:TPR repeat protein
MSEGDALRFQKTTKGVMAALIAAMSCLCVSGGNAEPPSTKDTSIGRLGEGGPDQCLENMITSASEGDADSQYRLAVLYTEGDGIDKDLPKAASLFRKAAEQGHDNAQLKMGYCYRDGAGVLKNTAKAYVWFAMSAQNGEALNGRGKAGELADEIRKTLPSDELQKAEAELQRLQKSVFEREQENYSNIVSQLNKAGWKVTMRRGADGSHNVEARKEGNTSVSHAPNWRLAFVSVLRQCENWPE